MLRLAALGLTLMVGTGSALAQSDRDWKLCNSDDDKAAVPACSRLIATGRLSQRNLAVAYYNRGLSHRRLGDNGKALADYDKALTYTPRDAGIYNNRGVVHEALGNLDQAMADYDKAVALDPKMARGFNNRGDVHSARFDFDKAIVDYQKAVALEPRSADYHYDLASAYALMGQYDRAIASATRSIELDKKKWEAYFVRGLVHYYRGGFASASADLRRAIDLGDSATAMIYRHLARARAGESSSTELEADASRLKSRDWPYSAIETLLGGRQPEALLAAAANDAQKCEARYFIAQWHLARGERAEGRASLEAAADACPRSEYEHLGAREELKGTGR